MANDPNSNANWFTIVLICVVVLVMFVGGGVFIGLQRARDARPSDQRQNAERQLRAFAGALSGGESNGVDSLYHITTDEQETELPGSKPALQFADRAAMTKWMTDLRGKTLADAKPVIDDVACTRRVVTMSLPSEQVPPPTVRWTLHIYRVDKPSGTIELKYDTADQTVIDVRFKE